MLRALPRRHSTLLLSLLLLFVVFSISQPISAGWDPLAAATVVGRPAVARNSDGRLLVFAVRPDRQIWYIASTVSSPTTAPDPAAAWTAWQPLGGAFCAGSSTAAAADGAGRVYVFGLTCDGRVWHKWQETIGDPHDWSTPWRQPRRTLDDPAIVVVEEPSIVRNVDGQLQIVARLPDGAVATMRQTSSDPLTVWNPWEALGGDVVAGPTVVANDDGRLETFARTADGRIWHKWQTTAAVDSAWSLWYDLGGNLASRPEPVRNADGRLQVFAVTPGGFLYHAWQQTAGSNDWTAWHLLGGEVTGSSAGAGDFLHGLSVTTDETGRLGVFLQVSDSNIWSRWQKSPGSSTWSYWTSVCGPSAEVPTPVDGPGSAPDLVVRRPDGTVWAKRCDAHCLGELPKVIPVLNYHGIAETVPWGIPSLFVDPDDFRDQLRYLRDEGFTPVTFDDLEKLCEIDRPVLITLDDGLVDNRTTMFPILQEAEFHTVSFTPQGVVSPITGRTAASNPKYVSVQQIQEMLGLVTFESHTVTHRCLTQSENCMTWMTPTERIEELEDSRQDLGIWTGRQPIALVYPKGVYDQDVLDDTRPLYQYGATTAQGLYRLGQDRYLIPRRFIHRSDTMEDFAEKLALCAHSEYVEGPALVKGCGGGFPGDTDLGIPAQVCTDTVCNTSGFSYCCDDAGSASWDQDCVVAARSLCDIGDP